MNMLISGITEKDGEKRAHIKFEEGKNIAEGTIPDCKITKSEGFTEEEVSMLEDYLMANLDMLKKKAAEINPIKAMLK